MARNYEQEQIEAFLRMIENDFDSEDSLPLPQNVSTPDDFDLDLENIAPTFHFGTNPTHSAAIGTTGKQTAAAPSRKFEKFTPLTSRDLNSKPPQDFGTLRQGMEGKQTAAAPSHKFEEFTPLTSRDLNSKPPQDFGTLSDLQKITRPSQNLKRSGGLISNVPEGKKILTTAQVHRVIETTQSQSTEVPHVKGRREMTAIQSLQVPDSKQNNPRKVSWPSTASKEDCVLLKKLLNDNPDRIQKFEVRMTNKEKETPGSLKNDILPVILNLEKSINAMESAMKHSRMLIDRLLEECVNKK